MHLHIVENTYFSIIYALWAKKRAKSIVLLLLPILGACETLADPRPFGITDEAPAGHTIAFNSGWKDGCTSGMSAYGNHYYKTMHKYTFSHASSNNPDYPLAWDLGFRHCRRYTANWLGLVS